MAEWAAASEVVVVSEVEWAAVSTVGAMVGALSVEDSAFAVDSMAATIRGTALSSALVSPTVVITAQDGVILIRTPPTILTRLIRIPLLIHIHLQDYAYEYSGPEQTSCPQANGRTLYLIKLTYQNNPWLAQDYWYTAGTLNFVTLQGEQNKTPIDSIDRAVTFQMNRDCGVVFRVPR